MKTLKYFSLSILFLLLSLPFSPAEAKEYEIPTIQIEVAINPDGTLRITKHLTYVFDGSFSWANYELPKTGSSFIRDIRIAENGSNYSNLNTEEEGTFLVEESNSSYNIKWFYSAEDEQRTFTVSYTLEGAIAIGPRWSEFFWNYFSNSREKSTDNIEILIHLPGTVADSSLYSWVREPEWANNGQTFDNGFQFSGTDISKKQAIIIRTAFPTSVFNSQQVEISNPDLTLDWIKNDEENFRQNRKEAAAERERLLNLGLEVAIIIIGISIICFIYFYRKYGARHQINLSKNESLMIPGNHKPASIGWLLAGRSVTGGHLTATLLDLARRGYLNIKETKPKDEGWFSSDDPVFNIHLTEKEKDSQLLSWESDLLNFLKNRIESESHKMTDIFKYSEREVSKWFQEWKKDVDAYGKERGWIDQESYTGAYWNMGVQILLIIVSAVGIFMIHPVMGFALIATVLACLFSMLIIRRSPKGEELYQTWKNYHSALKNAKEYSIPDNRLSLHFIYGIAFGLGKDNIERMFEQNPDAAGAITWLIILPGSKHSPANMATSFSNLAATGTISAGGGGTGAGATAGSAGGGASAGAG
jgi:uncharacterized membrane protein